MAIHLIDSAWNNEFFNAAGSLRKNLNIITPFIKEDITREFIADRNINVKLITRFNLEDFYSKVSDLSALKYLLKQGASIRGVKDLHSKLYIFDKNRVLLTSANLTYKALNTNQELGVIATSGEITKAAYDYFQKLWSLSGPDIDLRELLTWEKKIDMHRRRYPKTSKRPKLPDYGVKVPSSFAPIESKNIVKFFGLGSDRSPRNMLILDQVSESGCHWACTYPKGKRPRNVADGAIIFMARLVSDPNDIIIYGRAIGHSHVPGRDDATEFDISQRSWKDHWCHYIRVTNPEFIDGTLSDGISLNTLMDKFNHSSFTSTLNNKAKGVGNTNPRKAYMQQASVRLTSDSSEWLNTQLSNRMDKLGKIQLSKAKNIDWPKEINIYKFL